MNFTDSGYKFYGAIESHVYKAFTPTDLEEVSNIKQRIPKFTGKLINNNKKPSPDIFLTGTGCTPVK